MSTSTAISRPPSDVSAECRVARFEVLRKACHPSLITCRPTMKIVRIRAYQVDLPLHEGSYKWSGGKSVSVFDSTVVEVETDSGITGYGEVCPLGPFYLA